MSIIVCISDKESPDGINTPSDFTNYLPRTMDVKGKKISVLSVSFLNSYVNFRPIDILITFKKVLHSIKTKSGFCTSRESMVKIINKKIKKYCRKNLIPVPEIIKMNENSYLLMPAMSVDSEDRSEVKFDVDFLNRFGILPNPDSFSITLEGPLVVTVTCDDETKQIILREGSFRDRKHLIEHINQQINSHTLDCDSITKYPHLLYDDAFDTSIESEGRTSRGKRIDLTVEESARDTLRFRQHNVKGLDERHLYHVTRLVQIETTLVDESELAYLATIKLNPEDIFKRISLKFKRPPKVKIGVDSISKIRTKLRDLETGEILNLNQGTTVVTYLVE